MTGNTRCRDDAGCWEVLLPEPAYHSAPSTTAQNVFGIVYVGRLDVGALEAPNSTHPLNALVEQRLSELPGISDAARKAALHVHYTPSSDVALYIVELYVKAATYCHGRAIQGVQQTVGLEQDHYELVALAVQLQRLSGNFDVQSKWEVSMQRSYLALSRAVKRILDWLSNAADPLDAAGPFGEDVRPDGLPDAADWPPLVIYKECIDAGSRMEYLLEELAVNGRHYGTTCILVTAAAPLNISIRMTAFTRTFLPSAAPAECAALLLRSVSDPNSPHRRLLELSIRAGATIVERRNVGWGAAPAIPLPTAGTAPALPLPAAGAAPALPLPAAGAAPALPLPAVQPNACALRVAAKETSRPRTGEAADGKSAARPFPDRSAWARMLAPYVPEAVSRAILFGYCAPETRFWAAEWIAPGETLIVLSAPPRVFRRALYRKFDATAVNATTAATAATAIAPAAAAAATAAAAPTHVLTMRRQLAGATRAIARQTESVPDVDGADVYVSAEEAFRCGCSVNHSSLLCHKCWGDPQLSLEVLAGVPTGGSSYE